MEQCDFFCVTTHKLLIVFGMFCHAWTDFSLKGDKTNLLDPWIETYVCLKGH